MEARCKVVLRRYREDLAGETGIELTDDLSSALNLCGLFSKTWVNKFMVDGWTNYQRVLKMLELLPKRGPDAFDKFLRVLEDDYQWWAKQLREAVENEPEPLDYTDSPGSSPPCSPNGNGSNPNFSLHYELQGELQRIQQDNVRLMSENQNLSIQLNRVQRTRSLSLSSEGSEDMTELHEEINGLREQISSHPEKLSEALYEEFRMNEMWERLRRKTGRHY